MQTYIFMYTLICHMTFLNRNNKPNQRKQLFLIISLYFLVITISNAFKTHNLWWLLLFIEEFICIYLSLWTKQGVKQIKYTIELIREFILIDAICIIIYLLITIKLL